MEETLEQLTRERDDLTEERDNLAKNRLSTKKYGLVGDNEADGFLRGHVYATLVEADDPRARISSQIQRSSLDSQFASEGLQNVQLEMERRAWGGILRGRVSCPGSSLTSYDSDA